MSPDEDFFSLFLKQVIQGQQFLFISLFLAAPFTVINCFGRRRRVSPVLY
jgi:hypothetical protein